ncbi:protein phosphatase 1 regulatory subunit 15A [Elgaria multicarinata webbii]|uniref:protein phosphatase 1 regulatory subunit 15A n=1 Tax=Elgaria multicarinata webbii TaxID=159646 RepID=UPI002FCD1F77
MPPNIMFSQLTSYPRNANRSIVWCDPFGLRMAKTAPPEPSRLRPAGKVTMLLGRMTQLAMDWLKKCLELCQNFPTNLMRAVLMGIAMAAMPILEKVTRLLGEGEELGRDESKLEEQNLKGGHLDYLILNRFGSYALEDLEDLEEDGYFQECPKHLSLGSSGAEMDRMHLEEEGVSELCLRSPSIIFDFGNDWEGSSEEDDDNVGLEDMASPGGFPQRWLEDCYHPQIVTKGGYFGKDLNDDHSRNGELNEFEDCLWQSLESTLGSQGCEDSLESNGDLLVHEEQSFKGLPDAPEDGEQPEMNRNQGDKGALNSGPPALCGFKSSLVLSLFYSPSEDEEEEEEDNSEDWWSEDEMEDSGRSRTSLENSDSENGDKDLEAEDDCLHPDGLENLCGSFSMNKDPFHPLCFSKPTQAPKAPALAPPKPKTHKEIAVSFYLTRPSSKPEHVCSPPNQAWPQKDPRATHRLPSHKHCQPDSGGNGDPVPAETSSGSQEENLVIKKVRFSPVVTVHPLLVWDYATRAARRGPWEEMARDRCRFRRRIAEVGAILEPCLDPEHRAKVWRKTHGFPDSLQEGGKTDTPSSSRSARA